MFRKLPSSAIRRVGLAELSEADRHPVVVLIENVRSAYNVGSILRTCDAALVRKVLIAGYTPPPDHPKVRKTALGAEETVPWKRIEDSASALRELKSQGYTAAALEITDRPTHLDALESDHFPLVLVVGNEVHGVEQHTIDQCDLALEIPQYGVKASLNVAVAFGIAAMGAVERFRSTRPRPT